MAIMNHSAEEKQLAGGIHHSDKSDHGNFNHTEDLKHETVHEAAERGHAATDQ
jgi:hypothetical protein